MSMEAGGLVEQRRERGGVGRVNKKVIRKKRCKRRTTKRVLQTVPMMTLQKLFVSCREVFKGPGTVPFPSDVRFLCRILDAMKPEDVGLSKNLPFFNPNTTIEANPRVKSTTIYKCDNFSLCIFFLPANAVIPLHNHPGMTVFSKLLLGRMHIKSYDWVELDNSDASVPSSPLRLARLVANSDFTAPKCDTSVLYPTSGGNIHAFTAITPCAVLDVLGPPYSQEDGRDCTYYRDIPYTFSNGETALAKDGDGYGWLEEIEMPEDSEMEWVEYLGPQVIDSSC